MIQKVDPMMELFVRKLPDYKLYMADDKVVIVKNWPRGEVTITNKNLLLD